jgi:hypothetical protein
MEVLICNTCYASRTCCDSKESENARISGWLIRDETELTIPQTVTCPRCRFKELEEAVNKLILGIK